MTSIFALAFAASFLAVAQGAAAAQPKPPKTLCLDWGPSVMMLAIRSAGARLETSEGPVKLYEVYGDVVVDGISNGIPVAGSGHMGVGANGGLFHFGVVGGHTPLNPVGAFVSQHWEVWFNVVSPEASYGFTQSVSSELGILEAEVELEVVDCSAYAPVS